jgi:hypothetical protein
MRVGLHNLRKTQSAQGRSIHSQSGRASDHLSICPTQSLRSLGRPLSASQTMLGSRSSPSASCAQTLSTFRRTT